jgi:NADPH:quinone reductase-like Zn-dependent oxidoreductase
MAIVAPRGSPGAYAERIVVPAESVVRLPAGATDAETVSLPMNGLTAHLALDAIDLTPGQTVAVTGAVGGYAIQLARADGLRVIAGAAPHDEEPLRIGSPKPSKRAPLRTKTPSQRATITKQWHA